MYEMQLAWTLIGYDLFIDVIWTHGNWNKQPPKNIIFHFCLCVCVCVMCIGKRQVASGKSLDVSFRSLILCIYEEQGFAKMKENREENVSRIFFSFRFTRKTVWPYISNPTILKRILKKIIIRFNALALHRCFFPIDSLDERWQTPLTLGQY